MTSMPLLRKSMDEWKTGRLFDDVSIWFVREAEHANRSRFGETIDNHLGKTHDAVSVRRVRRLSDQSWSSQRSGESRKRDVVSRKTRAAIADRAT